MRFGNYLVTEILQYRRGEQTGAPYVQVRMEGWPHKFWVKTSEIMLDTNA